MHASAWPKHVQQQALGPSVCNNKPWAVDLSHVVSAHGFWLRTGVRCGVLAAFRQGCEVWVPEAAGPRDAASTCMLAAVHTERACLLSTERIYACCSQRTHACLLFTQRMCACYSQNACALAVQEAQHACCSYRTPARLLFRKCLHACCPSSACTVAVEQQHEAHAWLHGG